MTAKEMIDALIAGGCSKYSVAKKLGVSWNIVRLWQRGVFKPSEKNLSHLKEIYNREVKI